MLRGILAVFGAGVVAMGLASMVYAKQIQGSQSETTSLHGVESRNLAKDYPTLFSETSPNLLSDNKSNHADATTPAPSKISDFFGRLSNKVNVDFGGSYIDGDRILNVQYKLLGDH